MDLMLDSSHQMLMGGQVDVHYRCPFTGGVIDQQINVKTAENRRRRDGRLLGDKRIHMLQHRLAQ